MSCDKSIRISKNDEAVSRNNDLRGMTFFCIKLYEKTTWLDYYAVKYKSIKRFVYGAIYTYFVVF